MKVSRTAAVVLAAACLWGCSGSDKGSGSGTATAEKSASAAPSASAPVKEGAAITKRAPAVGDKVTSTETKAMKLKIEIAKPKAITVNQDRGGTEERVEECLAVEANKCSKVKVTYTKIVESEGEEGKMKDKTPPHSGKTYNVEFKDGAPVVTVDGKEPPKAELEKVQKDFKGYLKGQEMTTSLPDNVAVGDSLDGFAKSLTEMIRTDSKEGDKISATAKVASIKDEGGKKIVGVDITITMEGSPEEGTQLKVEMKGSATLRADSGAITALDVTGPLSMTFDETKHKKKLGGKGDGSMSNKATWSYSF